MPENKKIAVLLVDDNESLCRESVKFINNLGGFNAKYVTDGRKAIAYLKRHPKTDIVLLDINLGYGLNGVDVLAIIKSKFKYVQVIMLTVENSIDIGIECMKKGAADYINKPFNAIMFKEKALSAIEKKRFMLLNENDNIKKISAMAESIANNINNRLEEFSLDSGALINELERMVMQNSSVINTNRKIAGSINNIFEQIGNISKNILKTGSVIKSIVNYAEMKSGRHIAGKHPAIKATDSLSGLMSLRNFDKNISFHISGQKNLKISENKACLVEILFGLVENAYESITDKMNSSSLKKPFKPKVSLLFTAKSNAFLIQVKDNGIGITESNKQKVFAPYFSTKNPGSERMGSSLFIIKKLIENELKGNISFKSELMKGSIFTIEIPKP